MIAYDDNDRGSSDEHLDDFDDDDEEDTSDDDDDADADADVVTPSPIGTVNVPLRTLAAARDLERSMRSPRASLATPPRASLATPPPRASFVASPSPSLCGDLRRSPAISGDLRRSPSLCGDAGGGQCPSDSSRRTSASGSGGPPGGRPRLLTPPPREMRIDWESARGDPSQPRSVKDMVRSVSTSISSQQAVEQ